MTLKTFKKIRILILVLAVIIMATAVSINNIYLVVSAIVIAIVFKILVKNQVKEVMVDERIVSVSNRAARMTYVITTVFLAVLALFLILTARDLIYFQSLGVALSYVVILNMAIYALSFYYFNRKHGGDK